MQSGQNYSGRAVDYAERSASYAGKSATTVLDTAVNSGLAWFDLMLSFQRELQKASFQSFSTFAPASSWQKSGAKASNQISETATGGLKVVPVGEERLNVAVHTVQGETTRIRRRVITQPVEQQVTLRDEKVIVERRRPTGAEPKEIGGKDQVLTETVIEMSDSRQVPTAWKSLHVAEEVVLRKQVTERTEAVRETVRRDVVDVEHEPRVVSNGRDRTTSVAFPKAVEHDERPAAEAAVAEERRASEDEKKAPVPPKSK